MNIKLMLENLLDGNVLAAFNRELERAAMDAVSRPNIEDARKAVLTLSIVPDETSGGWMLGYEMKVVTPPLKEAAAFLTQHGRQLMIEVSEGGPNAIEASPEAVDADMAEIGKKGRRAG